MSGIFGNKIFFKRSYNFIGVQFFYVYLLFDRIKMLVMPIIYMKILK